VSTVLLDTSVASLPHPKKKGSALRAQYEPHMTGQILALSFQSVAELWAWAEDNNWGEKQRNGLDAFLRRFLVIPYDFALARVWARISAYCKKRGRRLEAGDAWIVATAVHREIPSLAHDGDLVGLEIPDLTVISYITRGKRET
jgi:tRNA(fMet)-specific endonuclease VapC